MLYWNAVFNKKIQPPFKPAVPKFSNDKETTIQQLMESEYFDDYFLKMSINDIKMDKKINERVQGFTLRSCYASREVSPTSSSDNISENGTNETITRKYSHQKIRFETDETQKLRKLQYDGGMLTNHRAENVVFDDFYQKIDETEETINLVRKNTEFFSYQVYKNKVTGKECLYVVKKMVQGTAFLKRQLAILYRLNFHPNMICMRDLFFDENHVFIVLDFMRVDFLTRIQNGITNGDYKFQSVVMMIEKLANFLKLIHSKNITHGNVKPENIFFKKIDTAFHLFRIVGISNSRFHDNDSSTFFNACKILDLACFGILSYFLLVGKLPERLENDGMITYKIDLNEGHLSSVVSNFLFSVFHYVENGGEIDWDDLIERKINLLPSSLSLTCYTKRSCPDFFKPTTEINQYFDQFIADFKNSDVPMICKVARRQEVASGLRRAFLEDVTFSEYRECDSSVGLKLYLD